MVQFMSMWSTEEKKMKLDSGLVNPNYLKQNLNNNNNNNKMPWL